jgi:hypothetical protein
MSVSIFESSFDGNFKFEHKTFTEFIEERKFETTGDISFSNCIFNEVIILENIIAREILFFECHFKNQLFLGKSTFHSISFYGCTTEKDIDIVSNIADSLSFRYLKVRELEINGDYQSIQFVSSNAKKIFVNDVNNNHSHRESKIEFLVENEFQELKLECSTSFSQIIFKGGFYKSVFFEGEFKKRILFSGVIKIDNLYFESSVFHNRIDFEEGNFEYISFYRSSFFGLIYINDVNYVNVKPRSLKIKDLTLHSSNFEKNVTIHISKIERFNSSNCNFQEVLNLNNFSKEKSESKMVSISLDGINQGSVIIEQVYADITLGGINLGNIYFKDLDIYTLYLSDYQNNGTLMFSNIKSGIYFVIQNTISGKMNFLDSDVNLFKEIIIADSYLDGANFNKYPIKILSQSKSPIAGYGIDKRSLKNSNLKNVYNQLKKIAKTKGDIDTANRFESLEHKKLLFSKKIGFDSVLLFLNYISNNYGRNWFQGVIFTLSIGFLFFLIYLRTLGVEFYFNQCYQDYVLFISSFPKLELKEYSELNDGWKVQLVLWLSRIFISYGIYQTISAFRKYGKT